MGELIKYELGQWERLKSLALDSVTSPHSKRAYESALNHFLSWYHSESRPPVSKAVVNSYKAQLERAHLSASTINVRLAAVRRLVSEAADNGLALNSVYFPTDVPRSIKTSKGLVLSQQTTLTSVADAFKKYLEYHPDAHLILIGHADKRGESGYNKALSERRAEVARDFLIAQGVPADHLETEGRGEDQNLTDDQVTQLVDQNPELAEAERRKALEKPYTLVLANNRRVDITLSTTGQESSHQYPFKAEDFATLVNRNGINKESVQMAAEKQKIEN